MVQNFPPTAQRAQQYHCIEGPQLHSSPLPLLPASLPFLRQHLQIPMASPIARQGMRLQLRCSKAFALGLTFWHSLPP
ncbi:hypothetical protein L2E82_25972 [Cichorium intybus]|uniref:Uncharacterized protein n=1 Tax=Cichorium intybus TaxID=13427 RepID=A0ACB9E552_CICIN|nr:hypothetical protein L2E82_25972 [Cichorium intybus]